MTPRPRGLVLLVAALVVVPSGSALAWWRTAGTGSGTGTAGTVASLGATGTATALLPGGPATTVTLSVSNPNAFAVKVTSVSQDGTVTATGSCTAAGFGFLPANGGAGTVLAAGQSTTVVLTGAATLDTTSPAACMGATWTVPLSLAVTQ